MTIFVSCGKVSQETLKALRNNTEALIPFGEQANEQYEDVPLQEPSQ
jgi:hypothetical protein